jgi:hypothetical protein
MPTKVGTQDTSPQMLRRGSLTRAAEVLGIGLRADRRCTISAMLWPRQPDGLRTRRIKMP